MAAVHNGHPFLQNDISASSRLLIVKLRVILGFQLKVYYVHVSKLLQAKLMLKEYLLPRNQTVF